jgi:hypothetical protein
MAGPLSLRRPPAEPEPGRGVRTVPWAARRVPRARPPRCETPRSAKAARTLDPARRPAILPPLDWGRSSAGRASRSQCEGRGFDSHRLHQSTGPALGARRGRARREGPWRCGTRTGSHRTRGHRTRSHRTDELGTGSDRTGRPPLWVQSRGTGRRASSTPGRRPLSASSRLDLHESPPLQPLEPQELPRFGRSQPPRPA